MLSTKVYSSVGADFVMPSVTLAMFAFPIRCDKRLSENVWPMLRQIILN